MKDGRVMLLLLLIASGVAFSGYLSATKFFTATCAFSEPCPYFLGYPACYFGFGMFAAMAILAIQFKFDWIARALFLKFVAGISLVGILFAGYFTLGEVPSLLSDGISAFVLGLPTCAYGLLVYIALFIISILASRRGSSD